MLSLIIIKEGVYASDPQIGIHGDLVMQGPVSRNGGDFFGQFGRFFFPVDP